MAGKRIAYVEGMDGQIELLADRVIIHRKGMFNSLMFGFNTRREIPVGAISEIGFRDASAMTFGVIEFIRSGATTSRGKFKNRENTVKFNKKASPYFNALKEKVFQLIEQHQRAKQ